MTSGIDRNKIGAVALVVVLKASAASGHWEERL